jgi:thiamine biosynthesis lipoprotein
MSERTDGYFDIHVPTSTHSSKKSIDPSGLVKGWAIQNVAQMLRGKEFKNFYVEIAGDIQTSGKNSEGREWSIGIRNPFNATEIVKVIYPKGAGVATSGSYERGSHIYDPVGNTHPDSYVSLTVLGPNVYKADCFATAAFAMGTEGMNFLSRQESFEAYAIDMKGIAVFTKGFEAYTLV